MSQDEQYLKLLSIFHYVVGGIAGLFGCFPTIYFVIGIGMLVTGLTQMTQMRSLEEVPVTLFGLFFTVFAGAVVLLGWAFAICVILAGIFLAKRKNYLYCLVMAGVECTFIPLVRFWAC